MNQFSHYPLPDQPEQAAGETRTKPSLPQDDRPFDDYPYWVRRYGETMGYELPYPASPPSQLSEITSEELAQGLQMYAVAMQSYERARTQVLQASRWLETYGIPTGVLIYDEQSGSYRLPPNWRSAIHTPHLSHLVSREEVEQHVKAYTTAWQTNDNTRFRRELHWFRDHGMTDSFLDYDKKTKTFSLPEGWQPATTA